MARSRFSPAAVIEKLLTYGPEPIGKAGAAILQTYSSGTINGSRFGGAPHYGMRGDPALTFSGYVSSPQSFQGAAQLGASRNLSVQDYPALPSASPPENLPTWLQDWTELEGLVPT